MPLVRWRRLLVATACFWIPVIIFSEIATRVHERDDIRFDRSFLTWLNGFSSPGFDTFALLATQLGDSLITAVFIIGLAGVLWVKQRQRQAVFVLAAYGGAGFINFLLKHGFERDRPSLWTTLVTESSYSFPSGHAMLSSAIAFIIILLLWNTRYRWWAVVSGGLYAFIVGATRLYLGVHFPSDVVAGWCVSAAWALITYTIIFKGNFLYRRRNTGNVTKAGRRQAPHAADGVRGQDESAS